MKAIEQWGSDLSAWPCWATFIVRAYGFIAKSLDNVSRRFVVTPFDNASRHR